MTIFLRALPYLIGVAVLAAMAFGIRSWDQGRLERAYDAGVTHERTQWELARADAVGKAASVSQSATRASEGASTRASGQTAASAAATAAQTQSNVEEITRDYAAADPLPCRPDGRPAQLPAGVLIGLDKARRAALRHP